MVPNVVGSNPTSRPNPIKAHGYWYLNCSYPVRMRLYLILVLAVSANGQEITVDGCLSKEHGRFQLTDADGKIHQLSGHRAELRQHIRDRLLVSGTPRDAEADVVKVTRIVTLLHASSAGVPPHLGYPSLWEDYQSKRWGLRLRYPKAFSVADDKGTNQGAVRLLHLAMPQKTYPGTNFDGGGFKVFVSPRPPGQAACKLYESPNAEPIPYRVVNGRVYAAILDITGSMGTQYLEYHLHTHANQLCYEFEFDFAISDGGGLDLPCALEWLTERNRTDLIDAVLGEVRFEVPVAPR